MLKLVGRGFLFLASASFLVCASMFIIGSYLVTWPILRKSPRQRHLTASMNLASAGMSMLAVLSKQNEEYEQAMKSAPSTFGIGEE